MRLMRFIRLGAREKICPGPGLALGGPAVLVRLLTDPIVGSLFRDGSRIFNEFIVGVKSYMKVTSETSDSCKKKWRTT